MNKAWSSFGHGYWRQPKALSASETSDDGVWPARGSKAATGKGEDTQHKASTKSPLEEARQRRWARAGATATGEENSPPNRTKSRLEEATQRRWVKGRVDSNMCCEKGDDHDKAGPREPRHNVGYAGKFAGVSCAVLVGVASWPARVE